MVFELSHSDVRYWNSLGSIVAGISIILCLFILISSIWIYSYKSARHTLDRISFRILLWSIIWEIAYSVDYLIVCANPTFVIQYSKTKACIAGVYFMVATLEVVNWLHTCIALNLMITICLNRNPIQLGLEKWYIIGSTVLGLGVPIIPAILGHFGYDPIYGSCYFTSGSETRVKDLISDMYLWQILSSVIATISVIATLIRLIRHGRKTTRLLIGGNSINKAFHKDLENGNNHEGNSSNSFKESLPSCLQFNDHDKAGSNGPKLHSTTNRLQDKLLKISIKISLYPIALIVVNGIMTGGDLFLTLNGGVNSKSDFIVFLVYNFMFAGRGIAFACLGIFIDPCLARGFKVVFKERKERQNNQIENDLRVQNPITGKENALPTIEISENILPYQGNLSESGEYSQISSDSKSGSKALISPKRALIDLDITDLSIGQLSVSYQGRDVISSVPGTIREGIDESGITIGSENTNHCISGIQVKPEDEVVSKKENNLDLPVNRIHHARSESALQELKRQGLSEFNIESSERKNEYRRSSEKIHSQNTKKSTIMINQNSENETRRKSSGYNFHHHDRQSHHRINENENDNPLSSEEIERIFQEAQTRL